MDINYIVNNQERIEEIFDSENWKNEIDIEKREIIILSLFHSKNWKQILPTNRIYLLQEIEKIQAEKQKRKAYKLKIVDEKSKYNKRKFDLLLTHSTKTIYIKKDLILYGKKQIIVEDSQSTKISIEDMLNVYLLSSIYHEESHIKTEFNIVKNLEDLQYFVQNKATIEEKEYIIWLLTKIDIEKIKRTSTMLEIVGDYYLYRLIPDEYYAFKKAKEKTIEDFSKIQAQCGIDEAFSKYMAYTKKNEKEVEQRYYKDKKRKLSYEQIYLESMKDTIQEMAVQRKVDVDTIYKEYCISKERYENSFKKSEER